MNGELVIGPLFILVFILYCVCAIAASFAAFNGFYLSVNPSPLKLLSYLKRKFLKIALVMLPLLFVFWFTASHAAVYCQIKRESHTAESGYYFHRMSFFLPTCGTVGTWNYGEQPPRSVPGLTLGTTKERVVLHSSLAIYLVLTCFLISWVCNYMWEERKEQKKKQKPDADAE